MVLKEFKNIPNYIESLNNKERLEFIIKLLPYAVPKSNRKTSLKNSFCRFCYFSAMNKLILLLIIVPVVSFGQVQVQLSGQQPTYANPNPHLISS
tara:strand:+ start:1061 stop:1345 length:285 start_codon:yes stop_codon:yes gene_type:complete